MTLRIKSPEDIEKLGRHVRGQVQSAYDGAPATPLERLKRPEQAAGKDLMAWADQHRLPAPWDPAVTILLADYLAHVPNGGARNAVEGGILKGQGVRKGYPDYVLDLAVGRYHGMRLELKAEEGGMPDPEQLELMHRLERAGYYCTVAWGYADARRAIETYLALA